MKWSVLCIHNLFVKSTQRIVKNCGEKKRTLRDFSTVCAFLY